MITTERIIPWAHKLVPEGSEKPVYMHCTLEKCRICYKIEIAKLIFIVNNLIEKKNEEKSA
jgi:hypothetical protein